MVRKQVYKVIWEDAALNYLSAQLEFVSKSSEDAPGIIKKAIIKKLQAAKRNPFIFESDKYKIENDGSYKAFVVFSYRISYRIKESTIRIIRIRHTSQDPLIY